MYKNTAKLVLLLVVILGISISTICCIVDSSEPSANNNMIEQGCKQVLFDGSSLEGWIQVPANSWIIKDGVMASTGAGRGYIYTKKDYSHYRLTFSVRQVQGNHQPCMLIFGTRPNEGEKGLDALGAIQLQPPNGHSWDYRPGKNNASVGLVQHSNKTKFEYGEWSSVEVLVDAEKGTARMAVAQPIGTVAIENVNFEDISAGKTGPIAWQMHNGGIFDEFKDVVVEINPVQDELLSTKQLKNK